MCKTIQDEHDRALGHIVRHTRETGVLCSNECIQTTPGALIELLENARTFEVRVGPGDYRIGVAA